MAKNQKQEVKKKTYKELQDEFVKKHNLKVGSKVKMDNQSEKRTLTISVIGNDGITLSDGAKYSYLVLEKS